MPAWRRTAQSRDKPANKKFGGQETNTYHFNGLIKEATPHAQEFVELREKQGTEDAARRSRKKPGLVVDNTVTAGTTRKK